MNVPPGWGSLPRPCGTSKLPENSPRTTSLSRALCNPLMTLPRRSPGCADPHLCPHPSLAVSNAPWQKEKLRHREAKVLNLTGLKAEPILQMSVWGFIYLCSIPEGPGLCLVYPGIPVSSTNMAIARTQYLFVERVDKFAVLVFMPNLTEVQFDFPIHLGHREQRI